MSKEPAITTQKGPVLTVCEGSKTHGIVLPEIRGERSHILRVHVG